MFLGFVSPKHFLPIQIWIGFSLFKTHSRVLLLDFKWNSLVFISLLE